MSSRGAKKKYSTYFHECIILWEVDVARLGNRAQSSIFIWKIVMHTRLRHEKTFFFYKYCARVRMKKYYFQCRLGDISAEDIRCAYRVTAFNNTLLFIAPMKSMFLWPSHKTNEKRLLKLQTKLQCLLVVVDDICQSTKSTNRNCVICRRIISFS